MCVVGAGKIKLINGSGPDNLANFILAEAVTLVLVGPVPWVLVRQGQSEGKWGGNEI